MQAVGPAEIRRILEVTDSLQLHREAVRIPLAPEGAGSLRLDGSVLEIIAAATDFDAWLSGLADQLRSMDLSVVPKAEA